MLLQRIALTWRDVTATPARRAKAASLASCLRELAPNEVAVAVAFLCGELRQRQIGVAGASLRSVPAAAPEPSLTVTDVDVAFATIGAQSGAGSVTRRRALLADLLGRATGVEQRFLRALLTGELRQGALAGVMLDALAQAADLDAAALRRALLVSGDLRAVAESALTHGAAGLARFRVQIGRPLAPMLAQSAGSVAAALAKLGRAAVEEKLDGVRVQLHRRDDEIHVFTRTLDDITARVPEARDALAALPARELVVDGELIALRPDGRPEPFQRTASRVGTRAPRPAEVPLSLVLFDVLRADGRDLIDAPADERHAVLAALAPPTALARRVVTADVAEAEEFLAATLARGHEGVMVKSLEAPYAAGRRGAGWWKVKPVHTLDLVVLAAEWGHGRRRGWLSNVHLGARDPEGAYGEPGGFVMLGKTFKGLTDEMLTWQTRRLRELAVSPVDDWVVRVAPELVVEVAFDGVQASPRYPAGVALRFARVKGYRADKPASEADTVATVRAFLAS